MPAKAEKFDNQPVKSRRDSGILVAIGAVAVALSVASYLYITFLADSINNQATEDIRLDVRAKASDLANIVAQRVESVRASLVLISSAKVVQVQDVEAVVESGLFSKAQELTEDFTFSYFWVDKDGKTLWVTTFSNLTTFQQYAGFDNSHRSFYFVPSQTHEFFVSELILAPDGVQRIIFANPILDKEDSTFKGVIGASSNLDEIGNVLTRKLTGTETMPMLLAMDGTILYAQEESMIGTNVFGDQFGSSLPEPARSEVITFVRTALGDSASGVTTQASRDFRNLTSAGQSASMASNAVMVDGKPVAIVFVTEPHTFAANTFLQLENLRILSVILIASIGGVAFGFAAAVMRWNRKLESLVAFRTAQLAARTDELEGSYRTLQEANRSLSQAHEDLKVHDRLQKEFVNIAAHELRTPVQPLLGAAEIIESQFGSREKIEVTKAEIDMIVRNAKRLERLSSDILEISRIESGSLKLSTENFSLSYIISDAIKDARVRSSIKPERVAIKYNADDIFVNADREKVTQVISNLLTNAIKFTQDGTINIKSMRDDGANVAVVTVTDTGAGIDPEVMPKLFEKFVTKSEHGTGIGLYISRKIVEAHGCRIWGENRKDGVSGATFGFTLPVADVAQGRFMPGLKKTGTAGSVAPPEGSTR